MQKDFQKWHALKSRIHENGIAQYFHERDVWWCSLGCNVGAEEDGKNDSFSRPVVILRKFGPDLYWGVPLTRTTKRGLFYYSFSLIGDPERSTALVSQLRILDTKRLIRRMGRMSKDDFGRIKKMVAGFLRL